MTPEKKYSPSSVFTVRLGFGSVILAAVITFIGLAWIFFLGVMAGRMYYGGDNAKQTQTPPTIQQNIKQENTIPNAATTTTPVQSKTGTTYSPVVKEDTNLEKIKQAQDTYNTTSATEQDTFKPLSLPSDATPADNDENAIQNEKPAAQENSVSEANEQETDFIEKVEENTSSHDAIASTATLHRENESSDTNKQNAPEAIATETHLEKMSSTEQDSNVAPNSAVQKTTPAASTEVSPKDAKSIIYTCTYQLGTFTVASNAVELVKNLADEGIEATILREEKNGTTLRYVFVYHTGPESSQQLVQEKFAKHGLANFIIRRKTVQ